VEGNGLECLELFVERKVQEFSKYMVGKSLPMLHILVYAFSVKILTSGHTKKLQSKSDSPIVRSSLNGNFMYSASKRNNNAEIVSM